MVQESKEEVSLFEHHRLLRDLIDPEHPLVKLAESIDWERLEEELKEAYPSTTGHPNKPIRLMVGLQNLKGFEFECETCGCVVKVDAGRKTMLRGCPNCNEAFIYEDRNDPLVSIAACN